MKEKELQKQEYILPEVRVYDVKSEGVICTSGEVTSTMDGFFTEETI